MEAIRSMRLAGLLLGAVAVGGLAGCDALNPTVAPNQTGGPNETAGVTVFGARPGVRIDPDWTASNGEWTFTGQVDPEGDSTDVVLEVGPGPADARTFNKQLPVAQDLETPGPLTITTRDIPNIAEICVRFAASNSAGTSFTSPLCFPHDLPSFVIILPPATTFSAPAAGTTTVITVPTFSVVWTETDRGSGVSARSLQRQIATDLGGACGTFADDGGAVSDPSPVTASGLLGGHCYQWLETLSDHSGNASATTSGVVRVDLPG